MASYGAMSDYLENKLINHLFRNTTYTSTSSLWVALYTTNPTDADVGTEVAGGGYTRAWISGSMTSGSPFVVTSSSATNRYLITFPTSTASWGEVGYFGIHDDYTAGNLIFYGALSSGSASIEKGSIMKIIPGNLKLELGENYMMSASISGSLLNHTLNAISYPTPGSAIYAALFNTITITYDTQSDIYPPPVIYVVTEVSGGSTVGYSRLSVGGTSYWSSPVGGSTVNSASLVFSYGATGSWGTITGIGIYDAPMQGNLVYWSSTPVFKTVYKGDGYYIPSGSAIINIDKIPEVE